MKTMIFAGSVLVLSSTAFAHARWKLDGVLKPRTDDSGLKEPAPCGGAEVDESRRATLTAGEEIEVEFEETVQHPGHYTISFSPDGNTGFDQNVIQEKIDDTQDGDDVPHFFKVKIKVPNEPCDECAFQLIQYMSEAQTNYYSCADVKIVASGSSTGTDTGTPTGEKPAAPKKLKVQVKKVGEP